MRGQILAALALLVVVVSVTAGLLVSRGGGPSASQAVCSSDIHDLTRNPPITPATRLTHEVKVVGDEFLPPPPGFVPRASARLAWHQFGSPWQVHASYHLVLARVGYEVDGPPGFRMAPFDLGQVIWLAVGTHVAFIPDAGPIASHNTPGCLFGEVYNAVNATSGQGLDSAGGTSKGDHF